MLISEINKNIASDKFKIPESAEKVSFDYELFKKLHSLGTSAVIYELFYDDDKNSGSISHKISWIEQYEKGNYDMTEREVWNHIETVFKIPERNPLINLIAFQYDDKMNDTVNIYIVSRQHNSYWIDYIISIVRKKVNLKKNFPKSYFINKYPKNRILLKNILEYKNKRGNYND